VSTLSGALAAESCAAGITAGNKCAGTDYISKGSGDCAADPCVAKIDFKAARGSSCCKEAEKCKYNTDFRAKDQAKITVECSYRKERMKGDYILCPVGKYAFQDSSYNTVCSDTKKLNACDSKSTGKEKLTESCSFSKSFMTPEITCEKDKYYWGKESSCEDRVYPCKISTTTDGGMFEGQAYCGPKSTDTKEESEKFKSEFKGACMDYDTCDKNDLLELMTLAFKQIKSNSTVVKGACPIYIRLTNTPGKCQADCSGGSSSSALAEATKNAGCTESEARSMRSNSNAAGKKMGLPAVSGATTTFVTSFVAASAIVVAIAALF